MKNELENIRHPLINNLNFLRVDITYRKPHLHYDMEIAFVLEGDGSVILPDEKFDISEGQAVIFNSCQVHGFSSENVLKLLVIQFSTEIFRVTFPQLDEIYFDNHPFDLTKNLHAMEALRNATLCYYQGNKDKALCIHGHISLLLDELLQNVNYKILTTSQQDKALSLQERLGRITSYIHEHFEEKISLDEIASREGFSRTYFSHFFKNNFGITFKSYLDNIRCEKARLLLVTTNQTLLSISYECGFSDIRSLNNAFKNSYGVLPKDYRKSTDVDKNREPTLPSQSNIDKQLFYTDEDSFNFVKEYFERYLDTAWK